VSCFGVSAAELVAAVVEGVLAAPVARLAGLVAEAAGDAVTGGVAGALVADVPDGLSDASGLFFALAPVVTHGVAAGALLAASGAVVAVGAGLAVGDGDVLGLVLGDGVAVFDGEAVADWPPLGDCVGVGLVVGVVLLLAEAVLAGVVVALLAGAAGLAGTQDAAGEGWRLAVVLAVPLWLAPP
jgi:hypothetical protein